MSSPGNPKVNPFLALSDPPKMPIAQIAVVRRTEDLAFLNSVAEYFGGKSAVGIAALDRIDELDRGQNSKAE